VSLTVYILFIYAGELSLCYFESEMCYAICQGTELLNVAEMEIAT